MEEQLNPQVLKSGHRLSKCGARSLLTQPRYRSALIHFLDFFKNLDSGVSILDVGCRDGARLALLRELGFTRLQGVDLCESSLRICRDKNLEVLVADADYLPFGSRFDVILMCGVLDDRCGSSETFSSIKRVCHRGTILYITVPVWDSLYWRHQRWLGRTSRLEQAAEYQSTRAQTQSAAEITNLLKNNGFRVLEKTYSHNPFPLIGFLSHRLFLRSARYSVGGRFGDVVTIVARFRCLATETESNDQVEKLPRTIMLSTYFPPVTGGAQRYVYELSDRLPPDRLTVVSLATSGHWEFDSLTGIPTRRWRSFTVETLYGGWARFRASCRLAELCLRRRARLICVGRVLPDGLLARALRDILGIPYVVFVYGVDLLLPQAAEREDRLLRKVLGEAGAVICVSEFTRREAIGLGVDPSKTHVLHPGVDLLRFRPDSGRRIRARRRLGVDGNQVILSVGRLVARKGGDQVVASMPEILQALPNAILLMAGRGPHEDSLRALAASLGLEQQVRFLGHILDAELPDLYRAADLFVMPSRQIAETGEVEGFGMVFLEASATAIPVIGGNSGGMRDAIVQGETGYLIDPNDSVELTRRATELLLDRRKARRMGSRGRQWVEANFSWDIAAEQLAAILREMSAVHDR